MEHNKRSPPPEGDELWILRRTVPESRFLIFGDLYFFPDPSLLQKCRICFELRLRHLDDRFCINTFESICANFFGSQFRSPDHDRFKLLTIQKTVLPDRFDPGSNRYFGKVPASGKRSGTDRRHVLSNGYCSQLTAAFESASA